MNSGDIPLVEYCYLLDKTKVDNEVFGTRLDVEKESILDIMLVADG